MIDILFYFQGCHHSAIECYEEALKQNSSCLIPLYHIAQAYQSLDMPEAEIEALTLLVKVSSVALGSLQNKCRRTRDQNQ